MAILRNLLKGVVSYALIKHGVPQHELSARCKKTGERMLLLSILCIVPLLLWDMALIAKIALQIGYALLMCAGLLLACDEEKKQR
ncbi:hypothetical protein [Cronobacter dublinensis]|uniref:hypothetical protein n=1 Tax=Cronobacter dublinensis TaxID=413497 RepID=UPI001376252C|nr:hypothetical protein [Cronobacter dublinensis]NCH97999.1 hypothetical protein [Cronobacter dublinensis]